MDSGKWLEKYSIDCELKYRGSSTIDNYKSCVAQFLYHFKNFEQPKSIPTDLIKKWLLTFEKINTRNHKLCAIKSFYEITVGMPLKLDKIPFGKKDKTLPKLLEESEIQSLFDACTNTKHKAIMCILYGCGLRVGEVISLKISDIDVIAGVIYVNAAKGKKDRVVPLPEAIVNILNSYFDEYHPKEYVFNGQSNIQYTERSINGFLKTYANKAGITKYVHAHKLRHSYATHNLESGVDITYIQKILGHSNPKTTQIYLHVSNKSISKIQSPIQSIRL